LVSEADKLVLPGVGAFRDAIAQLNETGLGEANFASTFAPQTFLASAWLQLLFTKSYETANTLACSYSREVVRFQTLPI